MASARQAWFIVAGSTVPTKVLTSAVRTVGSVPLEALVSLALLFVQDPVHWGAILRAGSSHHQPRELDARRS